MGTHFWRQNGPRREPKGDQRELKGGQNLEKLIFQKRLFYLSKTLHFESLGGPSRPKMEESRDRFSKKKRSRKKHEKY